MPHLSLSALALLLVTTAPEPVPVPIQRPTDLQPQPPPEPTPPPAAAEPAPVEVEPLAPARSPEPEAPAPEPAAPLASPEPLGPGDPSLGVIEGILSDTEIEGVTMAGVRVVLQCTCLSQPVITVTDLDGRYRVDDLPPGIYTVTGDRGGPSTERVVAVTPGEAQRLDFRVAPPTTSEELDRRQREATQAHTLLSLGGVSAVAGVLLLIGAGVENAKWDCKFGLDECAAAPRPQVARGLAIAGVVAVTGGAALVGLGIHRQRRLRASIAADDRSAAVVLSGRF